MRKLTLLCSIVVMMLSAAIAQASVIDAPHNETFGIKCSSCHSYSLWWKYSPAAMNVDPNITDIVDAVCMTCHNGTGGIPKAWTHSSVVMGSTLHGTWGVGCMACHDPHYQSQLDWVGTATSPYLVTASVDAGGVSYDAVNDRTIITYSGATTNANWPVANWANKSFGNQDRGLVLVQDTDVQENSFLIVSATPSQVVVQGKLNPNAVDTQYISIINPDTGKLNSATCNTFGLIYGQLIRDSIASKPVRFFDPNGGFVEVGAGTSASGVCQVCHVNTARFTNTGDMPGSTDSHIDRINVNCTTCHQHTSGFKSSGHDTTSFAWAGNCATCHNPTAAVIDITASIHGSSCGLCHVDPAGGGTRKDGDAANGVDGSALGATNASTCVDCHITRLALTAGTIHHTSAHGYADAGNCAQCHADATGKLAANHASRVLPNNDCVLCHGATAGSATGVPVDSADPKVHDACTTCHNNNGTLKAAYGKASAMPAGGGDCKACHGEYFLLHSNANHSTRVAGSANCTYCHTTASIVGTLTGVPVAPADPKVHDACSTCHNVNGSLRVAYGKASAMPAGGGDCEACHGAYFTSHVNADHSNRVQGTVNCNTCHPAVTIAGTLTGIPVLPVDPMVHDACTTCHETTGQLKAPYGKAPAMPAGGGDCNACHLAYFVNHGNANHVSRVATSSNCSSCHASASIAGTATGVPVAPADPKVHDACDTCHNITTGAMRVPYGKATSMPAGGGVCEACHGSYFPGHDHGHTMATPTAICINCHVSAAAPYSTTGQAHAPLGCATCHSPVTGLLSGSAAGKSSGAGCLTCHPGKFDDHTHAHSMTTVTLCVSCHTTATSAPYAATGQTHSRLGCQTCHSPTTGALTGSAFGKLAGADCQTCHAAYFDNHSHSHTASVMVNTATTPAVANCINCHSATTAPFVAAGQAHNSLGCASCHSAANGSLIGSANGRPTGGECITCHTAFFDGHTHSHTVAIQATDLGQAPALPEYPSGKPCSNCHSVSTWNAVLTTHFNNCATCHNVDRLTGKDLTEKVADVIAAGHLNNDPVACLACHWVKQSPATHGGHSAVEFAWDAATQASCGVAACHNYVANSNVARTIHRDECTLCHVDPNNGDYTRKVGIRNDGTAIGATVASTCVFCHNTTTYPTGTVHHDTPNANAGVCTYCHNGSTYGGNHTNLVSMGSCALCHAGAEGNGTGIPVSAANNKIHDACTTCHETNGSLKAPYGNATAIPDGGPGGNNGGGACEACHGTYFPNHDVANHTTRVAESFNCKDCHLSATIVGTSTGIPVDPANPKTHASCSGCHNANGSLKTSGPYAAVITPGGGACEACHGAYFASHVNANHLSRVADTSNCTTCHTSTAGTATGIPVSAVDNKVHDSCAVCHNTNGSLMANYGKASAMPAGGGDCNACHAAYFIYHINANHTARVATSTSCDSCHTATAGTLTNVPVSPSDNKVHDACATCHNVTTGALLPPVGTAPQMAPPGGACTVCHTSVYFPLHTHSHSMTNVALCTNCHNKTAANAPFVATGQSHDRLGCATCHSSATGVLIGSAVGKTAGANCQTCHPGKFNDHLHAHSMTTVALCTSCHTTATTAPYVATGETHVRLGCQTCHSGTTGALTGSAVGKGAGATCQTCHSTYFNGHLHPNHTNSVKKNTALTPTTANCAGCHSATTSPFVASGQVHATLTCQTCHSNTNGSLIGSAAGKTTGGECVTCHAAYFIGHTQHTATTHDVLMQATDLSAGAACDTCHGQNGMSTKEFYPNTWGGATGIYALHVGGCTTCHDSSRTANVNTVKGFTSVNHVIMTGSAVGCLDCHYDRRNAHGAHGEGDGTFTWISNCQSCHGIGGISTDAPKGEIVAGVHSAPAAGQCGKCHVNPNGGGALTGSATNATVGVKPHTCTECHIGYFNAHQHNANHDVLQRATDLSNNGDSRCNECHRRGGVSSGNPLFVNTFDGTDGILALHQGSCVLCHNSTRTTNMSASYSSVPNAILTGSNVGCLDCHADKVELHSSHDGGDFAWEGNCADCHSGANIAIDIHKKCDACHVNPNGAGTKRAGSNGSALLAEALPLPRTATCLTCHPSATYPVGAIHHDTQTAATNDCLTCHGVGVHRPNHSATVSGVAPCTTCHTATAGTTTGIPVDMNNGAVHDSCRTCHTFDANLNGVLVAPTNQRGVTVMPAGGAATNDGGGSCTACHTSYVTMHHNNSHSLIGECEYCHADPRNKAGGTAFQETAPGGGIPTHLPCEECHVTPKATTGWAGNQMTILAFNEGSSHSTTNYATDFTRTTAHSGGHVIANTVGKINNWGICFSCHDGATAARVNLFHAKATAITATNLSCGTTGTSRYAPGREATNTIGNFDFFASTFRPASTRPGGSGSCQATSEWTGAVKYGSTDFTSTDLAVPDPWNTATGTQTVTVPMFPAQTKNTIVTPGADNVKVTSAVWNGTNLIVTATNTNGCTALNAAYNGNTQAFTGTGICTATFATSVLYTTSVPTLNVTTTNTSGINVTGYRINDLTNPAFGHREGDGYFSWEATCQSCHGVGSGSVNAPKGEIIAGVHSSGCGFCHQGGQGAGVLIGSASRATAKPTPHTCTECHVGYFDSHLHGNGSTHAVLMQGTDLSAGAACNTCHKRGGTSSANPLFTNSWAGSDGIFALHQLGCGECHSSTRTTNVSAGYASVSDVIMTGINVGCLDCHASRNASHGSHAEGDGTFAWVSSCQDCHGIGGVSAVAPKGEIIAGIHAAAGGCGLCHQGGIGGATLIGSATNANLAPRPHFCTDCHSGYFDTHQHGTGTNHDVLMRAGDLSVGSPCNSCHKVGGSASLNPVFVNSWSDPNGILALHQQGCGNCHNSTRTTNVKAGYTSVQDVILRGTNVGCSDCHDNRIASHGRHTEGDGSFAWVSSCQTCHGTGSVSAEAPKGDIINGVHSDNCAFCHLGGIGGGVLVGQATNATLGVKPHACTECHTSSFDGHTHSAWHDVSMKTTDLSATQACNTCHRRGGTGTVNPLFDNAWLSNPGAGTEGILDLHQSSCALCHDSTRTTNVGAGFTSVFDVIMNGGTDVGCLDCHADRASSHAGHNPTDFVWAGTCNTCHTGTNIVAEVHNSNCGLCHVNPAGGGVRKAGSDGSALLGDASGLHRLATCLTCHPAATYPMGGIHHDSPAAATNNCTLCHAAVNHSTLIGGAATCVTCHTGTAGTATGAPVSASDGKIHDACRTCHTFDANLMGILVAPTNNKGVTAMPAGGTGTGDGGGLCTVCHTTTMASLHHTTNSHALVGECEYCHADPRNKVGGTLFQETAPGGGIPTHLPCEECHVTPKATTGWAGNQMTILAFDEGSTHSTTTYSADFVRTTAHSGGHVIANSVGKINNWGICFSCHDGITAARVNQFHAKATAITATNLSCGTTGTSRYAPGREATNTIGNFDFFASTFRPASTRPGGSGSCKATSEWTGSVKYGSTDFTATDTVLPDPWSTATVTLPIFPAQTPIVAPAVSADNVFVSSAVWNGANIIVTATNTSGCAALTATYNASNQAFTGSGTCTATFAASVLYSSSVPTLDVTTTNPDGLNVIGYRIKDQTISSGHAEGDGTLSWETSCQTCHATGSASTAAPKGQILSGVHSGDCGFCHQGGIGGTTLIGSATHATVGVKPHPCTECHVGYFDTHTHGTGSTHDVLMRAADLSGTAACNTCHRRGGTTSANPLFTNAWTGTEGILALHQNSCGLCHNSTRTTNVGASFTSVANVIMTGTTVSCLDCHASNSGTHGGHNVTDFVWAGNCSDCHTGTDIVGTVHKGAGFCSNCHVNPLGGGTRVALTDGSALLGDASGLHRLATCLTCHPATTYPAATVHHDTTPAVNGTCITCHTGATHGGNHTALVATDTMCTSCHTATAGTASGIPVSLADNKVHDACTTCHETNGTLKTGPIGTASAMPNGGAGSNNGGGNCSACHVNYFNLHTHSHSMTTVAMCTSCHTTATTAPYTASGQTHARLGCGTCHSATTGVLIGSAVGKVAGANCQTCHSTYFDGHGHSHNMVTVALCISCHTTATAAPYTAVGQTHARLGCTTCHSATNGALTGSAVGKVAGASCQTCHATYFNAHTHSHTTSVKVNTLLTPPTSTCVTSGCHVATTTPFVGGGQVHNTCQSCHSATNGSLIGSALGKTTGGECITCHTTYFTNHTQHTSTTHAVLQRATDLSGAALCNSCHGVGGTSNATKFTNNWVAPNGIYNLHGAGCTLCHDSTRTTNVKAGYASVQAIIQDDALTIGCLDCHANKTTTHGGHATDFGKDAVCTSCHTGASVLVNIHGDGTVATCTICHSGSPSRDNEKVGDASNGVDGNATLANGTAAAGTWSSKTCLTCHPLATYPTGGIHHDTPTASTNNCTTCHTAANHTTMIGGAATCITCHTATAGTASGAPVSLTDSTVHDACRTCHQFNAITLVGELRAAYGRAQAMPAGGTAKNDGGGLCTVCHTATMPTIHHTTNAHALIGECEFCHADPRNKAGGTNFQETAPGGGIPTHLPCEECHVTPKATTGWAGNQMTILAFDEGSTHSTTTYSADFVKTTAHSGGHVIANSVGKINNWGICFSCHGGGTAVRVNVFHAKATAITATNTSCGTTGTSRYAPGREATNTIGNFDFFASTFRPASTRPGGTGSCKVASEWTDAVKYGSTDFTATDLAVPDPWNTATGTQTVTVPMFAAQTPNTTTSPTADDVKVQSAILTGTSLTVTATNVNKTCAALSVRTQPDNTSRGAMSGVPTACTLTVDVGVTTPTTVDVTTSNTDGLNVTGYRVSGAVVAAPGTIALSAATYSVGEAGPTVTITATRTGGTSGAVGISYATSNGTALSGSDYTAAASTLSWADGDAANKTFTVAITNDTAVEGDETFNVSLSTPTGSATLGTPSTAVVTIVDNDVSAAGSIALSAATYSVGEAGPTVTITATRTGGSTGAVGISYATSNGTATAGSDYTAASSTLSWATGDSANKTFTVAITNDTAVEADETFNVILSTPTGGATLGAPTSAVVTIVDNDTPTGLTVGSDFTTTNVSAGSASAMTAISGSYTVGVGSNRLLVVVAQWEAAAAADTAAFTSGTWGGQNLTSLTLNGGGSIRNRVWIGYMKEAQLAAASGTTLNLNIATGANPSAYVVKAAWFAGANQTTPINHFVNAGSDTGASPHTFGTALNVINGGRAYYFETTNSGVTYSTLPTGYSELYDGNDPSANFALTADYKPITANGTENPSITQSAATRYALTGISIQP